MSFIIATIFFALVVFGNCTIPDYIHVCHHDDPDLGGCIKKSIEALRSRLASGIPELGVPSIDPFILDGLSFNTSSEATHLITNVTDVKAYGGSNFKLLKLIPTLTKNGYTFRLDVIIPHIHVEGNYEIDSKILLLEIKGKGPFHANISNYHLECEIKGQKVQKEGVNHLQFDKMNCDSIIGKTSIYLKNLFNGNAVLEKATNDAINDNAEVLIDEIRPSVRRALTRLFTDIGNKITLNFKYEELFP